MIATKLFVGCHIPADLRIELNQSLAWRQSRVAPEAEADPVEITYESRPYLGFFVDGDQADFAEIKRVETRIRNAIRRYCSEYPADDIAIYIFPQLFVS